MTCAFGVVYLTSMLLYDRLLERLWPVYLNRIRPKMKFLR